MSTKTFCDLCGGEIESYVGHLAVMPPKYRATYQSISEYEIDICEQCYEEIRVAIEECKERRKHEHN